MKKIFSIFALLLMAVTGAMAQTTYNVTLADGTEDAANWSITPTSAAEDETVTIKYSGTKRVKSITAVKEAAASGITNPVVGQVIGSDGKNYATKADAETAGATAVAMIAYVDGTSGLAIALADESGYKNWATAKSTCTNKSQVGSYSWHLPEKAEWENMFNANGGYQGLNSIIQTAGGSGLQEPGIYWSSTEDDGDVAWFVFLNGGDAVWTARDKVVDILVRACLAFTCGGEAPTDVLSGVFSVSASKKVKFSRGNLQATTSDLGATWTWAFAEHQWDCIGDAAANTSITGNGTVSANGTVDLFGWSTSATHLGIHNSQSNNDYSGDFADWGAAAEVTATIGADWFTLSKDEWTYLCNTRDGAANKVGYATVASKQGIIILPDAFTDPNKNNGSGAFKPKATTGWNANVYSAEDWAAMESAGAVFLPDAGDRVGASVYDDGGGYYWSSTGDGTGGAYSLSFYSVGLYPALNFLLYGGQSVRLVRVAE